jgi:hypothetical protein
VSNGAYAFQPTLQICVASRASEIFLQRLRQNNTTGKSAKPVQPFAQKYSA